VKASGEEKKKKKKDKAGKGEKEASKAPEVKDDTPAGKDIVVKETAGGVKVQDLVVGTGPHAKKGSAVSMRYVGKLQNGKVFDKNVKGQPVSALHRPRSVKLTSVPISSTSP
jgi:FK506-binding nuclear protein